MTNIFADFRRVVLAAIEDLVANRELPAGLDLRRVAVEPAARSRAWRSVNQRGDGARRDCQRKSDGPRRADRRRPCRARARDRGLSRLRDSPSPRRSRASSISGLLPRSGTRSSAPSCARARRLAIRTSAGVSAVNIEFVSANPTGPMHVGHGRGAVVGDALAGLPGQGRLQRTARVLRQRRWRPGQYSRAIDLSAILRGSG